MKKVKKAIRTLMRVKITRKKIIAATMKKVMNTKIMMVVAEITCRLNTKLKK